MPSVMQSIGTPNGRHNLDNKYRATLEHVDPELSKYNEIIQIKSIEEIYREKLQPAFDAYNEKQKRRDRRLDVKWKCEDALGYQRALDAAAQASKNDIGKKGRPPIRELVLQIGNPEQGYGCKGQTDESRERAKTLLVECFEEIQRRNPQIAWGDVVFHADEVSVDAENKAHGSFHLHISGVPICYENKQGPTAQVAFERCLHEMGFSSFEAWKHDLDNAMETVLERHGLTRDVMGNTEKHQKATEYHRQQKVIMETKVLEQKKAEKQQELQTLQQETAKESDQLKSIVVTKNHHQKALDNLDKSLSAKKTELADMEDRMAFVNDITQDMTHLYNETAQNLTEATETHEKVKQDVDALQSRKDALEGAVRDLEAKMEEAEQKLPALEAQISDAADELQAIETAIKKKSQEGQERYGTLEGFRAAIDASRKEEAKDKRIKELEAKLENMTGLIEFFVSQLPQNFRDMWEQLKERFSGRVQRRHQSQQTQKKEKKHEER